MSESIERRTEYCQDLQRPIDLIRQHLGSIYIKQFVHKKRQEISDIIHGHDDRLLTIIGPCSVHDVEEAIEYAHRLSTLAEQYQSTLLIVMRVYFEKPRTTIGWKGFIYDPHLDGSNDIQFGLEQARKLLIKINELELACGCEFLQPLTVNYLSDLIAWAAIGARTVESQIHREMVSGLEMPVGFKNDTSGCVETAIDACIASKQGHMLLTINDQGQIVNQKTTGNNDVHVVLRGGKLTGPNYSPKFITKTKTLLDKNQIKARIMIDCSHGNSSKNHNNQNLVIQDISNQIAHDGNRNIMGVMIESYLQDGNQKYTEGQKHSLQYGKSITDECIGWTKTLEQLQRLSRSVNDRRRNDKKCG